MRSAPKTSAGIRKRQRFRKAPLSQVLPFTAAKVCGGWGFWQALLGPPRDFLRPKRRPLGRGLWKGVTAATQSDIARPAPTRVASRGSGHRRWRQIVACLGDCLGPESCSGTGTADSSYPRFLANNRRRQGRANDVLFVQSRHSPLAPRWLVPLRQRVPSMTGPHPAGIAVRRANSALLRAETDWYRPVPRHAAPKAIPCRRDGPAARPAQPSKHRQPERQRSAHRRRERARRQPHCVHAQNVERPPPAPGS